MNRAYQLSAQALVASWPLPNGVLLGPRLLSDFSDAPFTGEAALLYVMSRTPQATSTPATAGAPVPVWLVLALMGTIGLVVPLWLLRRLFRAAKG